MGSERNWFWPHPLPSSPNSYIYIQQQTNFPGAHVSLESKLGDIFCRRTRTLLFPSLNIYFLWAALYLSSLLFCSSMYMAVSPILSLTFLKLPLCFFLSLSSVLPFNLFYVLSFFYCVFPTLCRLFSILSVNLFPSVSVSFLSQCVSVSQSLCLFFFLCAFLTPCLPLCISPSITSPLSLYLSVFLSVSPLSLSFSFSPLSLSVCVFLTLRLPDYPFSLYIMEVTYVRLAAE